MEEKIHCLELARGNLGKEFQGIEKLREMVGYNYPDENNYNMFEVKMLGETFMTVHGQTNAEIVGSLEEIKGMLIMLLEERENAKGKG